MPQESEGEPQSTRIKGSGAELLSDMQWEEARRRALVIGQLCRNDIVSEFQVAWATEELRLSRSSIYRLIKAWRASGGSLVSLAPKTPNGGRGSSRLSLAVEQIVQKEIRRSYLSKQKPSTTILMREIRKICRAEGFKPPAFNTVTARIKQIDAAKVCVRREGQEAARRLNSAGGKGVDAEAPLDVVQIDHTKIDVVVVEPKSRKPIGRPFLTVAIDVYSRAIVGTLVSLEAPSATSVGLCIAHCASDKTAWIEQRGIDAVWPVYGKPLTIHVDNGPEFHSEALKRGCEAHGIKLVYRPPGRPHYGGVVERVIGTTMTMIHELPGTTFSSIAQRGSYDSEKYAALTLQELEQWITLAICGPYHNSVHSTLVETPLAAWCNSISEQSLVALNPKQILIDFLPVEKRRIQRQGFKVDHIRYYSNALKPWITNRDKLGHFTVRRDPRDLSRIWILDPDGEGYLEVPYRSIGNPAITLWEHRAAINALRAQGRAAVNEAAIFNAVEQMREITDRAVATSKSERRKHARRETALPKRPEKEQVVGVPFPAEEDQGETTTDAGSYPEVEIW